MCQTLEGARGRHAASFRGFAYLASVTPIRSWAACSVTLQAYCASGVLRRARCRQRSWRSSWRPRAGASLARRRRPARRGRSSSLLPGTCWMGVIVVQTGKKTRWRIRLVVNSFKFLITDRQALRNAQLAAQARG